MVEGTLCLSSGVLLRAGKNVSSDISGAGAHGLSAGAIIGRFIEGAEGELLVATRKDWVGAFGSLNAKTKGALESYCANKAAIQAIKYDKSGYTSRAEAQTMLDVCDDTASGILKELKKKEVQTFINKV